MKNLQLNPYATAAAKHATPEAQAEHRKLASDFRFGRLSGLGFYDLGDRLINDFVLQMNGALPSER